MDKQSNSTTVPSISTLIAGTSHTVFTHSLKLEDLQPLSSEDMDALIDVLNALNEIVCAFSNQPRFMATKGFMLNAVGELVADLGSHLSYCVALVEQAAMDHVPTTSVDAKERAWLLIQRAAHYSEDLSDFIEVATQLGRAAVEPTAKTTKTGPAASDVSLAYAIYRYRSDWNDFLAASIAADERGEPDDALPNQHKASERVISNWSRPATSVAEAEQALELAIQDYEIGETPRIPAMMKAALGWLRAVREGRAAQ